jgi:hypothetical protein
MISEITFGTSIVKNSITNDSAVTTVDNIKPLSFLEFIRNTNVDYTPEEYNNFYLSYLKQWADVTNSTQQTASVSFVELYVNFLKEIVITYSTQSELKFFSTLDYTNPVDLDIAIPIFVEKIRQIIIFYKEKRDETKYVVDRSKIKGNTNSIEKAIFEKIYTYIFSTEQQPQYTELNLSLETIVDSMQIDIEEFVDVYGNYFDLPRVDTSTGTLRDELYSSNINDIDVNLFFTIIRPNDIFKSNIFLTEIPLAVNYATTVDLICDPTNPLLLIDNQINKCGITDADRESLKRELISKYIGVDFYYVSTLNNTLCAGKFITAQNPSANIPNLQTADTATVQSNEIKLLKDLGIFFKPDTQGLFQLNASNYTYSIDAAKLSPESVYIYPDPNVYGNVSVNSQVTYPLIFVCDYTKDVKNISSGFATGDPKISNYEQTFTPYYAKEQSVNKNIVDEDSLNLNFSDLYNKGYITKVQYDIFGNEYALFKDELGYTFRSIEDLSYESYILDLQLDGHVFNDIYEGYNFNYSTTGTLDGSIRSGISSLTVDRPSLPLFTLSGSPYTLFFREFIPYTDLIQPSRNILGKFRDAGSYVFDDGSVLPDPISADSSSYPSPQPYYYTELTDGGVSSFTPITRGYITGGISNSNFTLDVKTKYSDVNVQDYDCGYFTDNISLTNDYNYQDNYLYFDSVDTNSLTVVSSITGTNELKTQAYKRKLNGKLYVKNQRYSLSQPLSTALNSIFNKYSTSVTGELYNKVKDFDIIYDTIICETDSYLVFDKIKYEEGEFVTPSTKNTYFVRNSAAAINKFSNRFFNEYDKKLTFCVIGELTEDFVSNIITQSEVDLVTEDLLNIEAALLSLSGSNYKVLLPIIYQYDIVYNTTVQVFPRVDDILNYSINMFSFRDTFTPDFDVNIIKVDKPVITYNSFNNVYKMTYTCTDTNNMFYLYDIGFTVKKNAVTFVSSKFYRQSKLVNTTNFNEVSAGYPSTNYITTNVLKGSVSKSNGTLIL